MNNFLKRTVTALVYAVVMLAGTILHPVSFALIFAVILFFTLSEFFSVTKRSDFFALRITGHVLAQVFFFICFFVANKFVDPVFLLLPISFIIFVFIAELFRNSINTFKNSAMSLFGLLYIALPFSLLNFIVSPGIITDKIFYPWILAGLYFIIWVYDSAAYITGSLFGKHKIAANISPGKSWEGFIGGTVFAVVMGILNAVLFQKVSMVNWIIIALLAVTFGTLGDFFESKLKRELGIKDSGSVLPGHGGLLDRFDSLLFAAPVIFIWLNIMDKF